MVVNKLFANSNKTEYLLFNSRNINPQVININLDSVVISPSYSAKNLGVFFQSGMSLDNHISPIIKSCYVQLLDFRRIRPLISKTAAITLANSFIHSRINYCNSLFYGLPNYSIRRLQKVQNTAARIVTRSVRSSHITQILKSLHWLPLTTVLISRFVAFLIVRCLYMNLIIWVLCSAFDLILIPFVLPLLALYYYHTSHGFRSFSYAAPHLWNHLPNSRSSLLRRCSCAACAKWNKKKGTAVWTPRKPV